MIGMQLLAGSTGTSVTATFDDATNRSITTTITRSDAPGTIAKFGNLPPMPAALDYERVRIGDRTVGVIRFNIWMPVLAAQFDKAIDALRDTDAIVLDLRGNVGGVGGMSMGIAGHFLDSAVTIGTMLQRGTSLKFVANPRRVSSTLEAVTPYAKPLALVVDELSVSTTEIFVGGLQSLGRARVFGVPTSGQALPAVPERLPNGDILYHAIADFKSPRGASLEGNGVVPDAVTRLSRKAFLEGKDPARDAALVWAVEAAKRPLRGITPE
jgi:carboxyl-terminal processing protease